MNPQYKVVTHAPELAATRAKTGLGDLVAAVAQPIAKAVDAMTAGMPKGLQTDLEHCGGCVQRKEKLNEVGRKIAAKVKRKKKT